MKHKVHANTNKLSGSFSLFDPLEQSGESSSLLALDSCSIIRCPGGVTCKGGIVMHSVGVYGMYVHAVHSETCVYNYTLSSLGQTVQWL